MNRSLPAAGKRAASAALDRLPDDDFDRFLLIVDRDEFGDETDIVFGGQPLQIEEA